MNQLFELPQFILKIVCSTSLTDLLTCRAVCKDFQRIIDDLLPIWRIPTVSVCRELHHVSKNQCIFCETELTQSSAMDPFLYQHLRSKCWHMIVSCQECSTRNLVNIRNYLADKMSKIPEALVDWDVNHTDAIKNLSDLSSSRLTLFLKAFENKYNEKRQISFERKKCCMTSSTTLRYAILQDL